MSDVQVRHNFAISQDMWYDISTGDILTQNSASKMIKSRHRVADVDLRLLAVNAMQFGAFRAKLSNKRGTRSHPIVVKMVDKWSEDTFALRIKNAHVKRSFTEAMNSMSIANFDYQDVVILPKQHREAVVGMMLSEGRQMDYTSKELRDQNVRNRYVRTYQHQNSVKGQDRIFKLSLEDRILFAICDGHGDDNAINYITSHKMRFLPLIADPFPTTEAEAFERTASIFESFENDMRNQIDATYSGSTMVFAAHDLKTKKVFFGYIGDSRAVFQHDPDSEILATRDHKPSNYEEMERIRELGGEVTFHKRDVPRVNGNLATSRSFGDETLKSPGPNRRKDLVSVIPDILGPLDFGPQSVYFLASDGVFDVVKNAEVIELVRSDMERADIGTKVATMSRQRGSRDDITVGFVVSQ